MARKNADTQRADSRGEPFALAPHALLKSEAHRLLSLRAKAVLMGLYSLHNGFNNGSLGCSIDRIGELIGVNNPKANCRAFHELEAYGFIRCTKEYNSPARMAREWRLTFVQTGATGAFKPATNDYADFRSTQHYKRWRAEMGKNGNGNKKPPVKTEVETPVSTTTAVADWKHAAFIAEVETLETPLVSVDPSTTTVEAHIYHHAKDVVGGVAGCQSKQGGAFLNPLELRDYVRAYLGQAKAGAQSALAKEAGINGGTLSKFLVGRGLPDDQQERLQMTVAKVYPVTAWRALAA